MKRVLQWIVLAIMAWNLTGCETMQGFGRDLSNAGRAIEDAAR